MARTLLLQRNAAVFNDNVLYCDHGLDNSSCSDLYDVLRGNEMAVLANNAKQHLVISLDRQTIQKAKIIAARQSTSISDLLARQIEILAVQEESYERAQLQALRLLDQGFHMGGGIRTSRHGLHER